ncbi:MAG: hypothetical protein RIT81_18490 [Deltaproteobacteria bacterium]
MSEEARRKKTDLVLSNGEYAFTQDATTGAVKVLTGPTVVNVTGQEYPVVYQPDAGGFEPVDLEDAAQKSPLAAQGFYVELINPSENSAHPHEGSKESAPHLLMGQRVNIPGPTTFSLWPQQRAKVIEGHHLRSNQYILGRVYDEEAAKANWQKAVMKVAARADETEEATDPKGTITELTEEDLSVGKLFVIKGTEVSFYIPPTGVEVVPDDDGNFVRDALTLERLQYCILVDENGDKDYQRGPKVVFPKPTQRFFTDGRTGGIVYKPTELNPIQGIHVKVIAPYEEDGRVYSEGEELFITGKETSIYFPRPEHSLIRYDGNAKHFATAVPEGEARYVMDRNTGVIRTVHGPTMLLPDPRREVVVRRVLDKDECVLWYPGNEAAIRYNESLRALLKRTPTTRPAVSEGEVRRSGKKGKNRGIELGVADSSSVHSVASGAIADEWQRGATYAEPRTVTLDEKFGGVPAVRPWTGYAVMVVNKQGDRRVVLGPANVLLEYDEALEVLELSTGIPKGEGPSCKTVYLKVKNNRGVDRVFAETRDHVFVTIDLELRADFVGDDPTKWFSQTDYVGQVSTRVRSLVKERVRSLGIDELYADPTTIVEAIVPGGAPLKFEEHGLQVSTVEVIRTKVDDARIAKMFDEARSYVVASHIELDRAKQQLAIDKAQQALTRERAEEVAETQRFEAKLEAERITREVELTEKRYAAKVAELEQRKAEQRADDEINNARSGEELARRERAARLDADLDRERLAIRNEELDAETKAVVSRFEAADGPFAEAIQLLGNQEILAKVAEATSAQRLIGGKDVADVVAKLFAGTSLEPVFERVQAKAAPKDRPTNGAS